MIRYGKIENKNSREIALLKGYPCKWGRCSFCDYITDNSTDEQEMLKINGETLSRITGEYGALEIINSGSIFELPQTTLEIIRQTARSKDIRKLFFECHYSYRHRLGEMREFFCKGIDDGEGNGKGEEKEIEIVYKCGIETFDDDFRNRILKKGIVFDSISDVSDYFKSVCLLVGVQGQTQAMISRDIDILLENFDYGCINLYIDNTTQIKADKGLQEWFREKYLYLEQYPNIDVLWNNTDFGVGGDEL